EIGHLPPPGDHPRSSFASWAVQSAQPCRLMDLSLINVYKERLIGKGFAQSVGVGPRSALNGDQRMSVAGQLEIVVCRDAAVLAANIADRIVAAAHAAIAQRQRFTLVLSGGSTPERTFKLLSAPPRRDQIDWSRTWLFFGDDRSVPQDDPRS